MREIEQEVAEGVETNITPDLEDDFEALTSGEYGNFALVSCFLNGEATAAIASIEKDKKTKEFLVTPLFVAVTSSMLLVDHDGNKLESAEPPESEPDDD